MTCSKIPLLTGQRCVIKAWNAVQLLLINKLMIVLFIKNLYNNDIRGRVTGAKNVNILLDTFKTAQGGLLNLKKYEGLVLEDYSIHSIHTVNQISDIYKSSGNFTQPGNTNKALPPGQDGQSNPTSPRYSSNQIHNSHQCAAPCFGTWNACAIFGHLGKNFQIGLIINKVHNCVY